MKSANTDSLVRQGDELAGKSPVEKIVGIGSMGAVVSALHIHLFQ